MFLRVRHDSELYYASRVASDLIQVNKRAAASMFKQNPLHTGYLYLIQNLTL